MAELVKSLGIKQSDGTVDLAMLGTEAAYITMADGTTLEETIQNLKNYIDETIQSVLEGSY